VTTALTIALGLFPETLAEIVASAARAVS